MTTAAPTREESATKLEAMSARLKAEGNLNDAAYAAGAATALRNQPCDISDWADEEQQRACIAGWCAANGF